MNVGLSIMERCLYYRGRVYMNVGLSIIEASVL